MADRGTLYDPIDAIKAYLLTVGAVTAIVSAQPVTDHARIYSERLPSDFTLSPISGMPQSPELLAPTILIAGAGGTSEERAILGYPRYELRAYAPTTSQARELCYLAMNALNERSIYESGRVVGYVSFAGDMGGTMPILSIDPDTGTPYYYAFFGATVYAR